MALSTALDVETTVGYSDDCLYTVTVARPRSGETLYRIVTPLAGARPRILGDQGEMLAQLNDGGQLAEFVYRAADSFEQETGKRRRLRTAAELRP